jgi:putative FmdB family regulatory protein
MVIYDFQCGVCQQYFEARRAMDSSTAPTCTHCGSKDTTKVILGAPASVLNWRDSDSVHQSKRFRSRVVKPAYKEVLEA